MKKLLVSILVLALVLSSTVLLLSACTDPTDYDHTIILYTSQGDDLQKVTAQAIKKFEAKYPGWTVKHTKPGGYDDVKKKIVNDFSGNLQPDLAYCYPDHVAHYIQTGKVVDMNTFINSKKTVTDGAGNAIPVGYTAEELADFVPGYYAEGYAKNFSEYDKYGYKADNMLTIPFVRSTELLFYNNTALKACGLTPATTWDELWEQAPKLKEKYPTATVLGYDSESNWFITMSEQNGWGYTSADGEHYLFNTDKHADWLDSLNKKWEDGWLTTQEDYGSYTSGLFTKGMEEGGIVYCVGSSGGASHQGTDKFEWGVAPIPGSKVGDKVNNQAISQGPSFVMLTGGHSVSNPDEKQLMTWMFIKELLDPTFQAAFSKASGYNPVRQSVYELDTYKEFLADKDIVSTSVKVASTMTDRVFVSPAFVGSSEARTQVGNALIYTMQGEKSAQKALRDAFVHCGGKLGN